MNEIDKMLDFSASRINDIAENDWDNIALLRYWVGYHDALLSLKKRIGDSDDTE